MPSPPADRFHGYAPIREYAAIGDGRTAALVARDGSIDWLCLPALDSPTVFAAMLDAQRGGRFTLAPEGRFEVERRYVPGTNVLETTFHAATGIVRVTDAMTLPSNSLTPFRELVRRIDGVSGEVPLRWRVEPKFGYGATRKAVGWRAGVPVVTAGTDAIGLCAWGAGAPECDETSISGRVVAREGSRAILALVAAHREPLVFPLRTHVEERLERTTAEWKRWTDARTYDGPWKDEVLRSALALKLLIYAPSGAIAAAPTASLPEEIGGERNWDYRFCWIRDSSFTLDALLGLGSHDEAHAFVWWLMHASRLTIPRLNVLYRLDGGAHTPESELPFEGYRGSRPVRIGNAAAEQLQLDIYGALFETVWLYVCHGQTIDRDTAAELASVADLVCQLWRCPDSGIWEVRSQRVHFTHSKVMCWTALDRAIELVQKGQLRTHHMDRWRRERDAVRDFIETQCWSDRMRSYVRYAGTEELDASVLLMPVMRYGVADRPRMHSTIDAIRRVLGHGVILDRYNGEDGVAGQDKAFLTCSFWLVHALVLAGEREEATKIMEQLLGFGNDVGLYSEEIDPLTHELLGNFPQGLVHLALINAALAFSETARERA